MKNALLCMTLWALVTNCMPPLEIDSLTFTLLSNQSQTLKYEPIPLRIALSNNGSDAIETTLGVHYLGTESELYYSFREGEFIVWRRGWLAYDSRPPLKRIKFMSGQSDVLALDCFWQERFSTFDKVGKYTLKATWWGSLGPAGTSNIVGGVEGTPIEREATLEVTVVEGTETDKKCLEYMIAHNIQGYLSLDAKDFLFNNMKPPDYQKPDGEKLDTLKSIFHVAQNFNESRYSSYALATLLSVLDNKVIDEKFRKEIVDIADLRVSENKNTKQVQGAPHPRVLYTYALYLSKDNEERALELLKKAKTLNPDFVVAEKIESLIKKIEWEQKTKEWTSEDWQNEMEKKREKKEEESHKGKGD